MNNPTAAHIKLLRCAQGGNCSMFDAAIAMKRSDASTEKLFYQLVDANMLDATARDEPMKLTRLGKAVLVGGIGTFKLKKGIP